MRLHLDPLTVGLRQPIAQRKRESTADHRGARSARASSLQRRSYSRIHREVPPRQCDQLVGGQLASRLPSGNMFCHLGAMLPGLLAEVPLRSVGVSDKDRVDALHRIAHRAEEFIARS